MENIFEFGRQKSQELSQGNFSPEEHKAKFSHEAIAGVASFAAFKAFEDKQRKEGKPVSHAFAKELLAGIAGAEVDKLVETKGLNFVDREKAKNTSRNQLNQMYDSYYGGDQQYDPNSRQAPSQIREEIGK
ncbi:hypothetical protein BZA70DRAFT_291425 [Myxozyma melibiosi]|uniref:CipC-like antibiotic response protein n=1 Tax=Myxozyma melibiosi TaxID=54550 RepID=A0ABR1F0M6_9ASCO